MTQPTGQPVDQRILTDGVSRKLHPLTPLVRLWRFAVVVIAVWVRIKASHANDQWGIYFEIGIPFLGVIYGILSWFRTTFRIEGDDLRIDSGVLIRQTRHAKLSRVQAVDLNAPVAARFLGLSEVRMQVAGGRHSQMSLAYLKEPDANELRAELLARAAGVHPEAGEAPESALLTVPVGPLIVSSLLFAPMLIGVVLFVGIIGAVLGSGKPGAFAGALATLIPVGLATFGAGYQRFTRHFGFTIAESPDGLRLRHGLFTKYAQTVPPGRIQALRITEPMMWRPMGWAKVEVTVAGYGREKEGGRENTSVLLPVGPRDVAYGLVSRLLGADVAAIPVTRAPGRARWHRPYFWRGLGFGVQDGLIVTREGVWRRKLDVMPTVKVQSRRWRQGPWQRRLHLATLHFDTPRGPVRVRARHRDEATPWPAALSVDGLDEPTESA